MNPSKRRPVAVGVAAILTAVAALMIWMNRAPAIELEPIATGFSEPVAMIEMDGRMIVAERSGKVRELDGGTVLDLGDLVTTDHIEQGLLGLAARDGELFVHYTDVDGDTVVAVYSLERREEERTLLRIDQPEPMHNGGQLAFGPDGYLYVGLGDGGPPGDPRGAGQSTDDLLGSIVRLDPAGGEPELWAIGLRNPWRFSFDPATGDMWIADVGEAHQEEVNLLPAGERMLNFGWSIREGFDCFLAEECITDGLTPPLIQYSRGIGIRVCSAVVGGYVYHGARIPELAGSYVYGDFCSGRVWALDPSDSGLLQLLDTELAISSFAVDGDGELYLTSITNGVVYRIIDGS